MINMVDKMKRNLLHHIFRLVVRWRTSKVALVTKGSCHLSLLACIVGVHPLLTQLLHHLHHLLDA